MPINYIYIYGTPPPEPTLSLFYLVFTVFCCLFWTLFLLVFLYVFHSAYSASQVWQVETLDFLKSDKWRLLTISSLASPLPWVQDPRSKISCRSWARNLGPRVPRFKISWRSCARNLGPRVPRFKISWRSWARNLGTRPGFQDSRFKISWRSWARSKI